MCSKTEVGANEAESAEQNGRDSCQKHQPVVDTSSVNHEQSDEHAGSSYEDNKSHEDHIETDDFTLARAVVIGVDPAEVYAFDVARG